MKELKVNTPLGCLIAIPNPDPSYPGITIDLRDPISGEEIAVSHLEYTKDEGLVCRVWGDGRQEDYTHKVVYENIRNIFRYSNRRLDTNSPTIYLCTNDTTLLNEHTQYIIKRGCIPIVPQWTSDNLIDTKQKEIIHTALIDKCDEVWVFGRKRSTLSMKEISYAMCKQIPIRFFNDQHEEVNYTVFETT